MKTTPHKITLSAMFMAAGMVLPFLTGQMQQVGNMLLPMHLPVFLCGLICGWEYGAVVGLVLPLLRSTAFGMPVFYPTAIAMSFELATYGLVAGVLYGRSQWKCVKALYRAIIVAMITGRVVWGVVEVLLLGVSGNQFTWQMFLSGALLKAIPGIVLQLTLIPAIMLVLNKTGLVPLERRGISVEDVES